MSHATTIRPPISRVLLSVVIVMTASLVLLAQSARAATTFPAHQLPQPMCQGGALSAYGGVPNHIHVYYPSYFGTWYGGSEKVAYSADLEVWNGASFVAYDITRPYVWGVADYTGSVVGIPAYRFGVKYDSSDPSAGARFDFNGMPSGYYRVKEYFYWFATGQQQVLWSNWCQV